MPDPQDPLLRLQPGMDAITDDNEYRSIAYHQAKAIFDDLTQPIAVRARAQKEMQANNPSDFWNNLQGAVYGAGEGIITTAGMEGLKKLTSGWVNPGVDTSANIGARVAGNVWGSIFGLGKIGGAVKLAQATPKAFAALMGTIGAGQALGGHYEGERQKASQREFRGGLGAEIPEYLKPTDLSSMTGLGNVMGQAGLSALSGGLGQKAALAGKAWSAPVVGSQMAETGGSMGLQMLDSLHGIEGLKAFAEDNPRGLAQMGATALGMALGGAVGVPMAQQYMQRGRAQAQRNAPKVLAEATKPQRPMIPPTPSQPRVFNRADLPLDESTAHGLFLDTALNVTKENFPALQALDHGKLDNTHGTYFVDYPGEDGASQILQLLARFGEDDLPALGGNKFSRRWLAGDPTNPERQLRLNQEAITRPGALHYQPTGQTTSFMVPPDILPISRGRQVSFYNGPTDTPQSGTMLGAAPKETLVWVKTQDGMFPIPQSQLIKDVKDEAAAAPQDLRNNPTAKPRAMEIPRTPQAKAEALKTLDDRILGVNQRVDAVLKGMEEGSPSTLGLSPMADFPSLPFDLGDVQGAQKWTLKPWGSKRPQ